MIADGFDPPTETHKFCTFFLNELFLGIEVEKVQEIIRHEGMTRVPLAPPEIGGLINLRGQIVTAIDLRRRLALPDRQELTPMLNVVVKSKDDTVSLLVDDVGDVLDIPDAQFEKAPETLTGKLRDLIRGAYKLEGSLLLLLNVEAIIKVTSLPVSEIAVT